MIRLRANGPATPGNLLPVVGAIRQALGQSAGNHKGLPLQPDPDPAFDGFPSFRLGASISLRANDRCSAGSGSRTHDSPTRTPQGHDCPRGHQGHQVVEEGEGGYRLIALEDGGPRVLAEGLPREYAERIAVIWNFCEGFGTASFGRATLHMLMDAME